MRPATAIIDLKALIHNYRLLRTITKAKVLALVKADAYGHGAVHCAQALQKHVDGFAVSSIEEAITLRTEGIYIPILLLEGFFDAKEELPMILKYDLWCVIHALWQTKYLLEKTLEAPIKVWLKLDTGMHRVGLSPSDYSTSYHYLKNSPNVADIVLMSHFSDADEVQSTRNTAQIQLFNKTTIGLTKEVSLSNSSAILGLGNITNNWIRPGLMLYGVNPLKKKLSFPLRPVMTIYSKIISTRFLTGGERIGYGGKFITTSCMQIGIVAIGYADGYPYQASTGTPVWVEGRRSKILGSISMDMLCIDLTGIDSAQVGSVVELWGKNISVKEIADRSMTIPYQLLCNIKRVTRVYE